MSAKKQAESPSKSRKENAESTPAKNGNASAKKELDQIEEPSKKI